MLEKLVIRGLAIINRSEINFTSGLNVVTGETGAGKSILLKALQVLFGQKTTIDIVRSGDDLAEVVAEFRIPLEHKAIRLLEHVGIEVCPDSESHLCPILVRRIVTNKGRSSGFINDTAVTVPTLKNLGNLLLDMLGQTDQHRLYDPKNHQCYLDAFLNTAELEGYRRVFEEIEKELTEIKRNLEFSRTKASDRDYLLFRKEELDQFNPSKEDFESLQTTIENFESSFASCQAFSQLNSYFEGSSDSTEGILSMLVEAARIAEGIPESQGQSLKSRIKELHELATDLAYDISKTSFSQESMDELDLDPLQDRLARYQSLIRRHHCENIDGLLTFHTQLSEDLDRIDQIGDSVRLGLKRIAKLYTELQKKSENLIEKRRECFLKVQKLVARELKDLAMPGAGIGVQFDPVKRDINLTGLASILGEDEITKISELLENLSHYCIDGKERARILLSANPGEPLLALHKIASGGEASRIQLALKRVLSMGADTCVLVFDEIDTGISGKVADAVGVKLYEMSRQFQIICISHLAQVASYADTHLCVAKEKAKSKRIESTISVLDQDASLRELARLISGGEITKTSLDHASALKVRAIQKSMH